MNPEEKQSNGSEDLTGGARPQSVPKIFQAMASPGRRRRNIVLTFIGLLFVSILFFRCTTYILPCERGILESKFIPPRGVKAKPYEGGRLKLLLPGQKIHRFPTDVRVVEMNDFKAEQGIIAEDTKVIPSVEINTSDGSTVRVDATVLYRIADPYKVLTTIGPGREYEGNQGIISRLAPSLKRTLGELTAEEFYNAKLRGEKANLAEKILNEELAPKGLQVEHVLIRQYYYKPDYQKQIEQRKIQDQLVFTNQAQAEAAKEDARRRKIIAEGQATVEIEKKRGEAEVQKIRADAETYRRTQIAQGDLLVNLARAKGIEMENAAYQGAGSENLVGLEMAEVLKGMETILIPSTGKDGINPLNLRETLELFDINRDQPARDHDFDEEEEE